MNVTLVHLRTLVAVVRYGSFTAAAEALHRTQPAVTLQVKQLEQSLGLKLFDRSTRKLALTSVGAEIAPILGRLLQELDAVVDTARRLQAKSMGTVRVGCLPSIGAHFLPPLVAGFRRRHPGVAFFLHDALGDEVVAMVKAGEVEFGVTDISPKTAELETEVLWEDRLCAFCTAQHPLAAQDDVDVPALLQHDLLLLSHGSGIRRRVDAAFAMHGSNVVPACEAIHNATIVGLVLAGLGVGILPHSAVDLAVDPRLRRLEIRSAGFARQIALIKMRGRTLSPAAQDFARSITSLRQASETQIVKSSATAASQVL